MWKNAMSPGVGRQLTSGSRPPLKACQNAKLKRLLRTTDPPVMVSVFGDSGTSMVVGRGESDHCQNGFP